MSRAVVATLLLVLGIAAGIYIGWYAAPVKYVDTTPASLRADFRADYVLMIAERFHVDQDPEVAQRELAIFGSQSPAAVTAQAISFAGISSYSRNDLELLQELERAMGALSTAPGPVGTAP